MGRAVNQMEGAESTRTPLGGEQGLTEGRGWKGSGLGWSVRSG